MEVPRPGVGVVRETVVVGTRYEGVDPWDKDTSG